MFPIGEFIYRSADTSVSDLTEGNFTKKILILALAETDSKVNRAFLAKVLAAANLDLAEDTLFGEIPAQEPVNCFTGLAERPQYIFAFGLSPAQIGLSAAAQPYQPLVLQDTTWLFGDALSVLEPDRNR